MGGQVHDLHGANLEFETQTLFDAFGHRRAAAQGIGSFELIRGLVGNGTLHQTFLRRNEQTLLTQLAPTHCVMQRRRSRHRVAFADAKTARAA